MLDNASYHRTKKALALLEDHADHAFVVWLPRYSPELNLIEGLWGYLKRSALNNYFFGDIETLEAAIHDAFANLQQHPETALSLAYKIDTKFSQYRRIRVCYERCGEHFQASHDVAACCLVVTRLRQYELRF